MGIGKRGVEVTEDARPKTPAADRHLIEALVRLEEWAFVELVECHHESLLRLAFEGRSSLKTWIFRILMLCV